MPARPDLSKVPLKALGTKSSYQLSLKLNAQKILPNENGELRDWRGLAQLAGLPGDEVKALDWLQDPFSKVLEQWAKLPSPRVPPSLGSLQTLLGEIDRWDVHDDTEPLLVCDAEVYIQNLENRNVVQESSALNEALTEGDELRIRQGLPPQMYDAMLLFADEDAERAKEILDNLEARGLKICVRERDLLPGVFEHQAMLQLIADRCNRLVAIFSEAFLKTSLNRLLVSYAQSVGIRDDRRKVIPVTYENVNVPSELNYNFRLKFTTSTTLYNFYDKLYSSVSPCSLPSPTRLSCSMLPTSAPSEASQGAIQRVPVRPARNRDRKVGELKPNQPPPPPQKLFLCEQPVLKHKGNGDCNSFESGYQSISEMDCKPEKSKSKITKFFNKVVKKKKKVALEA